MADVPWTAFARAIRAAGFVTLAESRAVVVIGRANRSATLRRLPSLDEPTLHAALDALGLERQTFLSCLARGPIRNAT
jgi:hypothetical protein